MSGTSDVAIMDAVLRILENAGMDEVDLESVAAEAGVTRRQVIDRFHDRRYLLVAVSQHLAHQFELSLFRAAGGPPEQLSPIDRISAYITATSHQTSKAPLRLLLDPEATDEDRQPWIELYRRWTLRGAEIGPQESIVPLIARLVVDGLWQYEVLNGELPVELRDRIREELLTMLDAVRDTSAGRSPHPPSPA